MDLDFELSKSQIKDIASYIDLQDIKKYTKDYIEEETQDIEDKKIANSNSIWHLYTDDTICNVKIDNTKKEGKMICKNIM